MKIGLVCPYNMFQHSGGVQEIVIGLAKGLRAKRHEVKIITPRPLGFRGEVPENYILLGVSRRLNGALSTSGDVAIEVDGDEIENMLEREKFDVIHFHEPWTPVLSRQIVMRSKNSAHISTFHANLMDGLISTKAVVSALTPYGRNISTKMHLLTVVSEAPASIFLTKKARSEVGEELIGNLKYIPNPIDLNYFHPVKRRINLNGEGTKTILYVGRPDKRKGIDWLIEAFEQLVKEMPNTHLIIAGAGSRLKDLKQTVKSKKLQNVHFPGYVTNEEKRRLMGNADLACYPAMQGESFGMVVAETMAMGTPLLAGNNLGFRSVLTGRGRIGLVDSESTLDFSNRMAVFLTDAQQRKLFVDWAIDSVKQYDYPKIVDQYEDAYKEAVQIFKAKQQPRERKDEEKPQKTYHRFSFRRHAR